MNKLDAFNKDKAKCKKCKEYYDENEFKGWKLTICLSCLTNWRSRWNAACDNWVPDRSVLSPKFEDWCNNEQT